MAKLTTATMSRSGQVMIPPRIRRRLGLKAGSRFLVLDEDDAVILKSLRRPSLDQLGGLLAETARQAKRAGLKQSDIDAAVAHVRARK